MKNGIRKEFAAAEEYMLLCIGRNDAAHDALHIYRVLNYALDIAESEPGADVRLITAACLLHDIGRAEQFADPNVDHAAFGAEKAYKWLIENGFPGEFALRVKDCIHTHRYRSSNPPSSLEAKILFDADKLDVCSAVGIARTLLYKACVCEPLYTLHEDGGVSDGASDPEPSFFQEYKRKLENIYDKFYTRRGLELAAKRKAAAQNFYEALLCEVQECHSRC